MKIDLTKFKGLIITSSDNTLNQQCKKITGEEFCSANFKFLGNQYIEHIKTGDIYLAVPKRYLLA